MQEMRHIFLLTCHSQVIRNKRKLARKAIFVELFALTGLSWKGQKIMKFKPNIVITPLNYSTKYFSQLYKF